MCVYVVYHRMCMIQCRIEVSTMRVYDSDDDNNNDDDDDDDDEDDDDEMYLGHGTGDLSCDKGRSTSRRLVIEQDTIGRMHAIRLAVVDHNPVRILLGNTIW